MYSVSPTLTFAETSLSPRICWVSYSSSSSTHIHFRQVKQKHIKYMQLFAFHKRKFSPFIYSSMLLPLSEEQTVQCILYCRTSTYTQHYMHSAHVYPLRIQRLPIFVHFFSLLFSSTVALPLSIALVLNGRLGWALWYVVCLQCRH